ncbi:coiled-coil domain-containing protein [Mesorhizobium neociceri]|uniref:Uncharacterized protein n=1 Tax=Mesorhizobium neociceri TaxID=1307853 RepID=A0A838BDI2_9HYPH|nr:hypothetical protein [Mesorhizobium neociceri]MBA1144322.1 hypothetical protein [Mesorhizobium neociceri]
MVQSILFFALGFLCAGFLALLVAPAIWRRAVALTRKRVEASVPRTLAEIQADKDSLRAEYAMTTRRLEISVKTLREQANEQLVEISRGHEALKGLAVERKDKKQALTELGEKNELLLHREQQLQQLTDKLVQAERMMERRALELEKIEHMYDDASFSSSNRQIELVARESELEKLANDISVLRGQRKEADKRHQEVVAESKATRDSLKAEKKRTADLEKKLERLLATLADREDKLDRREKEVTRLRERVKGEAAGSAAATVDPVAAQDNSAARNNDMDKVLAKLEGDRERLEARLTTLAGENKRLKTELGGPETTRNGDDRRSAGDALREQMNTLAAEVVSLTAKLEGPDSPITKALAAPQETRSGTTSLADRVRALQKADSAG